MLKIPGLKPGGNRLGFPCGSAVKNQSVMQESRVQSLGQEDLLEKEIATHSNMLAWKIPCPEKPGGRAAVHGVHVVLWAEEWDRMEHPCTHLRTSHRGTEDLLELSGSG